MDKETATENQMSKGKIEIVNEAQRIEEALLYSSKGHFSASSVWGYFHYVIGLPLLITSAISGASIIRVLDPSLLISGILAITVVILSGLITFLNPREKANNHLKAGNGYDSLLNKVRVFRTIECLENESDKFFTEKLKYYSELKDRLNESSPQIPLWAYWIAKQGILNGEAEYKVDKHN